MSQKPTRVQAALAWLDNFWAWTAGLAAVWAAALVLLPAPWSTTVAILPGAALGAFVGSTLGWALRLRTQRRDMTAALDRALEEAKLHTGALFERMATAHADDAPPPQVKPH